jgi:tetratricopeptide (TPR) repeat protein
MTLIHQQASGCRGLLAAALTLLACAIPARANDAAAAAAAHVEAARAQRAAHEYGLAEKSYLAALAIVEPTPAEGVTLVTVLDGLADTYRMQGRHRLAEAAYLRSLSLLEAEHGPAHPLIAHALTHHLASLYRVQARFDEAEAAYARALAILEKTVAPDDSRLGLALIDLGEWHYERNRFAQAGPLYQRGIPIVQKLLAPGHPRVLELLQDHGRVMQLQGRYVEAEAIYKTMQALAEKHHGRDHPLAAAALGNLAGVYAVQGREAEAQAARERATEIADLPFRTYPYATGLGPQGVPVSKAPPLILPSATGVAAQPSLPERPPRVTVVPPGLVIFPGLIRPMQLIPRRR